MSGREPTPKILLLEDFGKLYVQREYIYSSIDECYKWNYTYKADTDRGIKYSPDFWKWLDFSKFIHKQYFDSKYGLENSEEWPLKPNQISLLESILSGKVGKGGP